MSKFPKTRKLIKPEDGTIAITWDNKLHNWDGPALYPEGNEKKAKYFLYGIEYSKEDWNERLKQREGLPWYKTPAILADRGAARN
jgi:hypothetical protein